MIDQPSTEVLEVPVSESAAGGERNVTVTVGEASVRDGVEVVAAERCEAVADQHVCDLDGDGDHRDLDGSGDLTSGDLRFFFATQHTEPWTDRDDLFDVDGDGTVGQPDVVALFERL